VQLRQDNTLRVRTQTQRIGSADPSQCPSAMLQHGADPGIAQEQDKSQTRPNPATGPSETHVTDDDMAALAAGKWKMIAAKTNSKVRVTKLILSRLKGLGMGNGGRDGGIPDPFYWASAETTL